MLDLEDLFFIVGTLAVIITYTLIFLQVLHPPYDSINITSIYVQSHVESCLSNAEDINCVIQRMDNLNEDLALRFENNLINILIFDSLENEMLFVSRDDLRDNELRLLQSIASCNLFRNCPRHYFSDSNSNYHIIIT